MKLVDISQLVLGAWLHFTRNVKTWVFTSRILPVIMNLSQHLSVISWLKNCSSVGSFENVVRKNYERYLILVWCLMLSVILLECRQSFLSLVTHFLLRLCFISVFSSFVGGESSSLKTIGRCGEFILHCLLTCS